MKQPVGEKVLMVLRPSRLVGIKYYFAGFLFLALWIFFYFDFFKIIPTFVYEYRTFSLIILAISFMFFLAGEMNRRKVRYIIYESKIAYIKGFFNIYSTSVEYNMIANYLVRQNFFQRIFNVGDLIVQSVAGSREPEIVFKNIPKLSKVKRIIDIHMMRPNQL